MNDEQFVNDIIDRLTEDMKVDREEGNTVDDSTVVHNIKGVGNLMMMHWKGFHDPYCESIDNVLKLTTNILKYDSRKWKKYKQLHGV